MFDGRLLHPRPSHRLPPLVVGVEASYSFTSPFHLCAYLQKTRVPQCAT